MQAQAPTYIYSKLVLLLLLVLVVLESQQAYQTVRQNFVRFDSRHIYIHIHMMIIIKSIKLQGSKQPHTTLSELGDKLIGLLIAHPHLPVRATSERFPPARVIFRSALTSESHWLQPLLVLNVRWWPGTSQCGRLFVQYGDRLD